MAKFTKITVPYLRWLISNGFGHGYFDDFKSLLWLRKGNSTWKSGQELGHLPGYTKNFNFFSWEEGRCARLFWWLGAEDIREQMAAWPFAHSRPAIAANLEDHVDRIPGTYEIARDAGIDLGIWPTTSIPYFMSIDLAVTLPAEFRRRLLLTSVKPRKKIELAGPTDRLKERMDLERLYAKVVDSKYLQVDGDIAPKALLDNVDLYMPSTRVLRKLRHPDWRPRVLRFRDEMRRQLDDLSLIDNRRRAERIAGLPREVADQAFNAFAWRGLDIDLRKEVLMTYPAVRGGEAFRRTFGRFIFSQGDPQ